MLQRIDELINLKVDFAIETTLTTKSYANTIETAKQNGYDVTLVYFWLKDVELAIQRVNTRVKEGGHYIEDEVIKRRYKKGVFNLINIFTVVSDYWVVLDNSDKHYIFIAEGNSNQRIIIHNSEIWETLKSKANE